VLRKSFDMELVVLIIDGGAKAPRRIVVRLLVPINQLTPDPELGQFA